MPPVTRSTASETAFEFILNRAKVLEGVPPEPGAFAQHFSKWYVVSIDELMPTMPTILITCVAVLPKVLMWQNFTIWAETHSSYLPALTMMRNQNRGKFTDEPTLITIVD